MVRQSNTAVISMYEKMNYDMVDSITLGKRLIEDQEY